MEIQCIFSFDSKEQEIYDMKMDVPIDIQESTWIRNIIERVYGNRMHVTKDLWKMSLCISYDDIGAEKMQMLKDYFARNGKYIFWPSCQEDDDVIKLIE